MCLIVIAKNYTPEIKLLIAANRDEFYNRAAMEAHFWDESPVILAGKDMKAGGTWLAVDKMGRFAAITNYRDMRRIKTDAPSRGMIIPGFLLNTQSRKQFLQNLTEESAIYNGFNLILGTSDDVFYFNNITNEIEAIKDGIHAISNHFPDTPWYKVERAKQMMSELLSSQPPGFEQIFDLLHDNSESPIELLPDTGLPIELEMRISSIFIQTPTYGTRCSTIIMFDNNEMINFAERNYNRYGEVTGTNYFSFSISPEG